MLSMAALIVPQTDRLPMYSPIQAELGLDFVYILNNCHYFVARNDGKATQFGINFAVHEGVISGNQVQILSDSIKGALNSSCDSSSAMDVSRVLAWRPGTGRACAANPGSFYTHWSKIQETADALFSTGTPVNYGMRLVVAKAADQVPLAPPFEFPLGSISQFEVTESQAFDAGISKLVVGDDAEKLRSLRASYLAGTYHLTPGIPVHVPSDPDAVNYYHVVYARESLPFEIEMGGVALPP